MRSGAKGLSPLAVGSRNSGALLVNLGCIPWCPCAAAARLMDHGSQRGEELGIAHHLPCGIVTLPAASPVFIGRLEATSSNSTPSGERHGGGPACVAPGESLKRHRRGHGHPEREARQGELRIGRALHYFGETMKDRQISRQLSAESTRAHSIASTENNRSGSSANETALPAPTMQSTGHCRNIGT